MGEVRWGHVAESRGMTSVDPAHVRAVELAEALEAALIEATREDLRPLHGWVVRELPRAA